MKLFNYNISMQSYFNLKQFTQLRESFTKVRGADRTPQWHKNLH